MAKKVTGYIKLQIPAGKATPAPPVGPALGQHGVNIVQFTKEFNARTADQGDLIIPVVITVYQDKSFTFVTKTPPAAVLLKKACNIQSGSGVPNKTKVAKISKDEVRKIAELKMQDLTAANIDEYLGYHHEITCNVEIPLPNNADHTPCGRVELSEREASERKHDFEGVENCMNKKEIAQESGRCLRCDHFGFGIFKGGREKLW